MFFFIVPETNEGANLTWSINQSYLYSPYSQITIGLIGQLVQHHLSLTLKTRREKRPQKNLMKEEKRRNLKERQCAYRCCT